MEKYKNFWDNLTNFSGRSSRSYFWIPFVINTLLITVGNLISNTGKTVTAGMFRLVTGLFVLILITPSIAVIIRRVRDTGVKNNILWSIVSIISFGIIFGFIPTNQFKQKEN